MYILSEAKKLDFLWKLWRRNANELKLYDHGPQKTLSTRADGSCLLGATAESQGISSDELLNLYKELSAFKSFKPHSMVIVKNGKVITKAAWAPYKENVRHITHSMCKSITSLAIGIAENEKILTLKDKLCDIFPDKVTLLTPKRMRDITIEHLLTMSTGARFFEGDTIMSTDWVRGFIDSDAKFNPGEKFEYNSLNSYMLSAIIQKKTGMTLSSYLKPRLFEPMGIHNVLWEKCPMGIDKGGWGCYLSTMELAKFGLLFLNEGTWLIDGKPKNLVPKDYIARAVTKTELPTKDVFGYGYQVWTADSGYMFNGMFGQYVIVFPKTNTVVALNSGSNNMFADPALYELMEKYFVKGRAKKLLPLSRSCLNRLRRLEHSLEYDSLVLEESKWQSAVSSILPKGSQIPKEALELDKKIYDIFHPSAALLPVMVQCMQNNYSDGISQISFALNGALLNISFTSGNTTYEIPMGFSQYADSELSMNGEIFSVSSKCCFKTDEDDRLVLKISICFTELTSTRQIKIVFLDDGEIQVKMSETPVFEYVINDYILRNEDMFPKSFKDTFNNERDTMEFIIARLSAPILKGQLKK